MKCEDCPHAIWDYETYYGTSDRKWFVDGCKLDKDEAECEKEIEEE